MQEYLGAHKGRVPSMCGRRNSAPARSEMARIQVVCFNLSELQQQACLRVSGRR
jgi:hypothetical protein